MIHRPNPLERNDGKNLLEAIIAGDLSVLMSDDIDEKTRNLDALLEISNQDIVEGLKLYRLGVFENRSYEIVEMEAGRHYPPHYHKESDATFFFITGSGIIHLNSTNQNYKPGDRVDANKGVSHGFTPASKTLFLAIQTPPIKNQQTGIEDFYIS